MQLIRSKTKLEARYTEIMLQMLKFILSWTDKELKATFVNKSGLSPREATLTYPCIPSFLHTLILGKLSTTI